MSVELLIIFLSDLTLRGSSIQIYKTKDAARFVTFEKEIN
jgi:hypothetical protein